MPATQASSVNLGKLISKHRLAFSQKWGELFVVIFMFCLGPAVYVGLTYVWTRYAASLDEVMSSTPFLKYLPIFLGAICVLVGLLRLVALARNWPLAADLYEGGLEYTDGQGLRVIPWDSIDGIWQHIVRYYEYGIIPVGTSYSYQVQLQNGETLLLDNRFSKIKQLGRALQERLTALQLPKRLADVRAGQEVKFGHLVVTQDGLTYGGKSLKWEEAGQVTIQSGALSLTKKGSRWGKWANIKVQEIPNVYTLYALLQSLGVEAGD